MQDQLKFTYQRTFQVIKFEPVKVKMFVAAKPLTGTEDRKEALLELNKFCSMSTQNAILPILKAIKKSVNADPQRILDKDVLPEDKPDLQVIHAEIYLPKLSQISFISIDFAQGWICPDRSTISPEASDFRYVEETDNLLQVQEDIWDCVISVVYEVADPVLVRSGRWLAAKSS